MTEIKNEQIIKIVLIGESGVGKTCIISQFVENKFNEDIQITLGADFTSRSVKCGNNLIIKLHLWDTAGQEMYRSITKIFYKNTSAVVFVYDITNKKSFDELKKYWINEVKSASNDVIYAIVGNKSDLYENEQVSDEEGKELAKEIGALFHSVSAKTKKGIDNLFLDIVKVFSHCEDVELINDKKDNNEFVRMEKNALELNSQTIEKKKRKFC